MEDALGNLYQIAYLPISPPDSPEYLLAFDDRSDVTITLVIAYP